MRVLRCPTCREQFAVVVVDEKKKQQQQRQEMLQIDTQLHEHLQAVLFYGC